MNPAVHEGMKVVAADGAKLGRVITCAEESFVFEKGHLFKKDFQARYDDVEEVKGEEIHLRRASAELDRKAPAPVIAAPPPGTTGGPMGTGGDSHWPGHS